MKNERKNKGNVCACVFVWGGVNTTFSLKNAANFVSLTEDSTIIGLSQIYLRNCILENLC